MATASSSWMPAAGRHNVSIGSSLSKALKARKGQPPTQRNKALPERDFYALRCAHPHPFPPVALRHTVLLATYVLTFADNHKPASIDPTKPGTLEVNPGREVTSVRVERPTVNVRFRFPLAPPHSHSHSHSHTFPLLPLLPSPLTRQRLIPGITAFVQNNEVIVFEGDEKPAKEWECVLIYDEATQTFTLEKLDSLVNLNYGVKAPPRTRPAASRTSLRFLMPACLAPLLPLRLFASRARLLHAHALKHTNN